jgi:hypothetical protein
MSTVISDSGRREAGFAMTQDVDSWFYSPQSVGISVNRLTVPGACSANP